MHLFYHHHAHQDSIWPPNPDLHHMIQHHITCGCHTDAAISFTINFGTFTYIPAGWGNFWAYIKLLICRLFMWPYSMLATVLQLCKHQPSWGTECCEFHVTSKMRTPTSLKGGVGQEWIPVAWAISSMLIWIGLFLVGCAPIHHLRCWWCCKSYSLDAVNQFLTQWKNPNGCRPKMTYFTSLNYTNYTLATGSFSCSSIPLVLMHKFCQ